MEDVAAEATARHVRGTSYLDRRVPDFLSVTQVQAEYKRISILLRLSTPIHSVPAPRKVENSLAGEYHDLALNSANVSPG